MAAGDAVIGALRVTVGADTASLETGLKSSQAAIAAFAGAVGGVMATVANKVASSIGQMAATFTQIITDMDKLEKTSQKLGIPVEQLSALAYAADLSGVSFDTLTKATSKLGQAIIKGINDPSSDAAKVFKKLEISTSDLKEGLKDPVKLFGQIAEKFSEFSDDAGKGQAAATLFGQKLGADMIPLMNEAKKGLDDAAREAKEFGIVVSAAGAKAASEFSNNMTRLGAITKGVFVQALEAVLPTLADLSAHMVEAKKNSTLWQGAIDVVTGALKGLITGLILTNAGVEIASATWAGFFKAISLAATGDFAGAFDVIKQKGDDIATTANRALKSITGLWDGTTKGANDAAVATEKADVAQKSFGAGTFAAKNAVDQFLDSQQKKLSSMNAEISTLGMGKAATAAAKVELEAFTAAQNAGVTMTQAQIDRMNKLKDAIAAGTSTLEGWQVTQANLTSTEAFNQKLKEMSELLANNGISVETFSRAMAKAMAEMTAQIGGALAGFASGFSQLFGEMAKKNREFAIASKAFGILEATINTYVAFTKALASPAGFPFNYILAAGVLAAGLAKVAAITSQTIPTAATGLSMQVPGGLGGGDSRLFQSMVEPGEQIDITPGAGRTSHAVVDIRGLQDKRYSLDEVKQIMKGIGDAMKFGYKFENA